MTVVIKHKSSTKKDKAAAIGNNKVGNYEKHPFFVKKANEAKALIKVVGLPQKKASTK